MKYLKTLFFFLIAFSVCNQIISLNGESEKDNYMDELTIFILADDGMSPRSVATPKVRAWQATSFLEIHVDPNEKIIMKVEDEYGMPVYLRQYTLGNPSQIRIEAAGWTKGDYKISFENARGTYSSYAEFSID